MRDKKVQVIKPHIKIKSEPPDELKKQKDPAKKNPSSDAKTILKENLLDKKKVEVRINIPVCLAIEKKDNQPKEDGNIVNTPVNYHSATMDREIKPHIKRINLTGLTDEELFGPNWLYEEPERTCWISI